MILKTAVVVAGDIAVFLAFVIFGKAEHEITRAPALPLKSAQGWPPDAQQQGN